jgi:hypothetical protein
MNEQDDSKSKNKKGLRKRQKPQMARSVNYNDCKLFMGRVHQPRKDDPTQTDEVECVAASSCVCAFAYRPPLAAFSRRTSR